LSLKGSLSFEVGHAQIDAQLKVGASKQATTTGARGVQKGVSRDTESGFLIIPYSLSRYDC